MKILIPFKQGGSCNCWRVLPVFLILACFAPLPMAHAISPPPDGGYPGGNTAEGQNALFSLTTGTHNTAVGLFSLRNVTDGSFNTALGAGTLLSNTGSENTAIGAGALLSNTTGDNNTANGESALFYNTTGIRNTAVGAQALLNNTTASNNTAIGVNALQSNTSGNTNTASGVEALQRNNTGSKNTATGVHALRNNTTGSFNIALGEKAGINLTTGDNNIDIGYNVSGTTGESGTIRIGDPNVQGATFIAGISGATVPGGAPVVVDTSGHLGTIVSSVRFKDEIAPMDRLSEAIFALKPVTFRYKKVLDPQRIPQFGLVAEDVEKISPDLVARGAKGEVYTVRYEAVNAMLLNEFLKEHKKVEQQQATINSLEASIAKQQKQIEALTVGFQKVSAQLEMNKAVPHVIADDR
jgi:Chaperone of endosialidase